ncbi:MAG: response regulator transcription factor [Verrucomicrobia bacterium]|nr:response regulator transcription factor [Verrucomicrobiota bacterium]
MEAVASHTRIVLADDHDAVRGLLKRVLEQRGYAIVGEAGRALETILVCERTTPAVVVLDLLMPELCGAEVIRRLRVRIPLSRVVVFSGAVDDNALGDAVLARPHGFVKKSDPLNLLFSALQVVEAGGRFFSPSIDRLLDYNPSPQVHNLSSREVEVLHLIAQGKTNKEIGQSLGISTKTVDNHRTRLMRKLNLHNAVQVARYAIQLGLAS